MQTNESNNQNISKKPELRLPFRNRKSDIGEWSYDHRQGLCVTVIVFLLSAIFIMSAKIRVGEEHLYQAIIIELEQDRAPKPEEDKKQLQKLDFSDVKNLSSNENAKELNEKLRDDRGTKAEELYDEAKAVQDRIRANRAMYEKGLREEQAINDSRNKKSETTKREDQKVKGAVTVSFSFSNPTRNSARLITPAYMCEGGGQVVLNVTLDHNGYVISTSVDKSQSTTDNCMVSTAVNAAKGSRFNLDTSAPSKHSGTITYIFIPQ